MRVYEIGGEKVQDAVLSFAGEIASACEADGTEKSIGSAEFSGNGLSVSIKPYSIKDIQGTFEVIGRGRLSIAVCLFTVVL